MGKQTNIVLYCTVYHLPVYFCSHPVHTRDPQNNKKDLLQALGGGHARRDKQIKLSGIFSYLYWMGSVLRDTAYVQNWWSEKTVEVWTNLVVTIYSQGNHSKIRPPDMSCESHKIIGKDSGKYT